MFTVRKLVSSNPTGVIVARFLGQNPAKCIFKCPVSLGFSGPRLYNYYLKYWLNPSIAWLALIGFTTTKSRVERNIGRLQSFASKKPKHKQTGQLPNSRYRTAAEIFHMYSASPDAQRALFCYPRLKSVWVAEGLSIRFGTHSRGYFIVNLAYSNCGVESD